MMCSRCGQKWQGWLVHPLFGLSPRRPCPGDRDVPSAQARQGRIWPGLLLLVVGGFLLLVIVVGMISGEEETTFYIPGFVLGASVTGVGGVPDSAWARPVSPL